LVALCGLTLNLVYMVTGSVGVNPAYAVLEVPLILARRNAGYLVLDRYTLDGGLVAKSLHHVQASCRASTDNCHTSNPEPHSLSRTPAGDGHAGAPKWIMAAPATLGRGVDSNGKGV
jgi:hypothetical protein